MKREVSLEDLKKLYSSNDMVKADCQGCPGCSDCCQGMGESIILDPFDVYRLRKNLNVSFEELLDGQIELNVVDGVILPNLKMDVFRCGGPVFYPFIPAGTVPAFPSGEVL